MPKRHAEPPDVPTMPHINTWTDYYQSKYSYRTQMHDTAVRRGDASTMGYAAYVQQTQSKPDGGCREGNAGGKGLNPMEPKPQHQAPPHAHGQHST